MHRYTSVTLNTFILLWNCYLLLHNFSHLAKLCICLTVTLCLPPSATATALLLLKLFTCLLAYLKGRGREQVSNPRLTPQIPPAVRARSGQSQESGTPSRSPSEWQGHKCLGHHPLPPRHISRKLVRKHRAANTWTGTLIWDMGIPRSCLACCTTTLTITVWFSIPGFY